MSRFPGSHHLQTPVRRISRMFPRLGVGLVAVTTLSAVFASLAAPAGAQTSSTTTTTTVAASTTTTTTTLPATTTSTTSTSTTTTLPATTSTTTSTTLAAVAPGVPQNVAAAVTGTAQITVTWQAPAVLGTPALNSYKIVRLQIDGNVSTTFPAVSVPANQLSFVFNDLKPGAFYAFYVRAESATSVGPNSVFTTPLAVPGPTTTQPASPTGPTGQTMSIANGALRVTWIPPTNSPIPVTAYRVSTIPNIGSAVVNANTLAVTFTKARPGVAYLAQISSIGANGRESAPVITNSVVIPAPPPTAPPATLLPLPGQPPTPPGRPQPCIKVSWPRQTYGRPRTFAAGAPQGVYVWHDGRYFQVRVYNPGPGPVVFTGSVAANANVSFLSIGLERGDRLNRGRRSANFSMTSNYDIDGFRISASCATLLTFSFAVNGVPVNPAQIFVGPTSTSGSNPFQFVR
jgi:hypothetical protein